MDPSILVSSLMGLAFAMPRFLSALVVVPIFGSANVGRTLRAAVAAGLAVPVVPVVTHQLGLGGADFGPLILLTLLKESLIGFVIGYCVAIPFWVAEALGVLIDNQRGAAISEMLNPASGNDGTPLGILLAQAYLVLFLLFGGLSAFVGAIYTSYLVWPVTGWLPTFDASLPEAFLSMLDGLMRTAVLLAAPIMAIMLICEIVLALVGVYAPQMPVFFMAMPIKSAVALFILALYVGVLFDFFVPSVTDWQSMLGFIQRGMR